MEGQGTVWLYQRIWPSSSEWGNAQHSSVSAGWQQSAQELCVTFDRPWTVWWCRPRRPAAPAWESGLHRWVSAERCGRRPTCRPGSQQSSWEPLHNNTVLVNKVTTVLTTVLLSLVHQFLKPPCTNKIGEIYSQTIPLILLVVTL